MDFFSFIANADPIAIEGYYQSWKTDASSVDSSWNDFFKGFHFALSHADGAGSSVSGDLTHQLKELHVVHLIHAYRTRGHLLSTTNPIRKRKDRDPGVDLKYHQLSDSDLQTSFVAGNLIGLTNATLAQIIDKLQATYTRAIGIEYMHIRDTKIREWCRDYFESTAHNYEIPLEKKKRILSKLNEAVVFENFLHKKYVGQKRFSLEGGENTIPALDALVNQSADLGVEMVAIGMAHRGRLNVLANILGKTYEFIFKEFEGNPGENSFGDGDVKYHLGYNAMVKTPSGKNIRLELVPNPSHLEAVNPVIEGYCRAEAELTYQGELSKVLPILIHGDAALAGQGIVYEVAQMSQLKGYQTGGTVHFVINNQIGFTTDFDDARSSDYCTAVGKVIDAPIIHVNGDDAEAVLYAVEFAARYRQTFAKDIFVDMLCYRKHGHNESDEPKFTQPQLYALIEKHLNPREVYNNVLIGRGEIDANLAKTYEKAFQDLLQDRLNMVKQNQVSYSPFSMLDQEWKVMRMSTPDDFLQSPATGISINNINKVAAAIGSYPSSFKPIKKIEKLIDERKTMLQEGKLNWALGELLAYGSILQEGRTVRLSGQDVERGTFSHRHAILHDENTDERYNSLNHIEDGQAKFNVYNSFLSEYAVLGFEYGYGLASPNVLTIWEAQFGDFANGAQTVIDQFISSGESKWQRMNGLVMLLPHGYEGQGPEHSNARPERFLQLSAEYNMIVANVTTPANFFHLIRRQLAWEFRKPLFVMSPKQLLRHPMCVSSIDELTEGNRFKEVIVDDCVDKKVKRVLFCSGKIYYDLVQRKLAEQRDDVAIVRIEQLHPMPENQIEEVYARFPKASYFWVQEEPKNMGAWTYILRYEPNQKMKLISRKASASPATGFSKVHDKEQNDIIERAFAKI
jgi:2-oxoglutarate dehydrogenase E1 component